MSSCYLHILAWIVIFEAAVFPVGSCRPRTKITRTTTVSRAAVIWPDYADTTVPVNIAPLNFLVREDAAYYFVRIIAPAGQPIQICSASPKIRIPIRPWHRLLAANRSGELRIEITTVDPAGLRRCFQPIRVRLAPEPIDPFLVYRSIRPIHNRWKQMSLWQRNLENFRRSLLLENRSFRYGCVNCHTLLNNDPETMLLHARTFAGPAIVLFRNGRAVSFNSATHFGSAPMGHAAWHPSGKLIVFTVYKVRQFFHTTRLEVREGLDLDSALGYFLLESRTIKTSPQLAQKDRLETFPAWSPDGRYLYFCTTPIWWSDDKYIPDRYDQIKYDLVRVPYDLETDSWGPVETVLSAEQTGRSIVQPRISPDGRWLVFCMCSYGCFPTFRADSDLYIMDLRTGEYHKLACSSD